jgi:hypothetical protein
MAEAAFSHERLMFERPQKNDLDTALSMLMHESRHKLMDEVNRIESEAIKSGIRSNRLVTTAIKAADDVHKGAMEQAQSILLDFIERMERAPAEVVGWARPHIEISTTLYLVLCRLMDFRRIISASRISIELCFSSAPTSCCGVLRSDTKRGRASPELKKWKAKRSGSARRR